MALAYETPLRAVETKSPVAVICDLDGTLASCHWRTHLVDLDQHQPTVDPVVEQLFCSACDESWPCQASQHEREDWGAFFDGISCDAPVPGIARLLAVLRLTHTILLTSGRPDDRRYHTEFWLGEHGIDYDRLLMRRAGDQRNDAVIKRELYESAIQPHFDVRLVIDDRPMVCDMWRELGLPVVQVIDPRLPPLTSR